jgi:hypothetical protein
MPPDERLGNALKDPTSRCPEHPAAFVLIGWGPATWLTWKCGACRRPLGAAAFGRSGPFPQGRVADHG